MNLLESAEEMQDKKLSFTSGAAAELAVLSSAVEEILDPSQTWGCPVSGTIRHTSFTRSPDRGSSSTVQRTLKMEWAAAMPGREAGSSKKAGENRRRLKDGRLRRYPWQLSGKTQRQTHQRGGQPGGGKAAESHRGY